MNTRRVISSFIALLLADDETRTMGLPALKAIMHEQVLRI